MDSNALKNIYYCMERIIVFEGIEDVLQHIVQTAASLTRSDAATLRLFNIKTGELDIKAGVGVSESFLGQPGLKLGEGIIGKVVQSGESFITDDILKESRCSQKDLALMEGIKSVLSIPLRDKESAIGCITIYRKNGSPFMENELLLLSIFGAQAVEAVEKTNQLESLQRQAIYDYLTDMYNKKYLLQRIESEIKRADRHNHAVSIIFIDIDNFKKFNDEHGHLLGDKLLKDFSTLIQDELRKNDIVGRFGGEEFIIVASETDKKGAVSLARKLLELMKKASFLGSEGLLKGITFSAGISSYPEDGNTSTEIIQKADEAMYIAKSDGKCRIELYQPS